MTEGGAKAIWTRLIWNQNISKRDFLKHKVHWHVGDLSLWTITLTNSSPLTISTVADDHTSISCRVSLDDYDYHCHNNTRSIIRTSCTVARDHLEETPTHNLGHLSTATLQVIYKYITNTQFSSRDPQIHKLLRDTIDRANTIWDTFSLVALQTILRPCHSSQLAGCIRTLGNTSRGSWSHFVQKDYSFWDCLE